MQEFHAGYSGFEKIFWVSITGINWRLRRNILLKENGKQILPILITITSLFVKNQINSMQIDCLLNPYIPVDFRKLY